MTLQIPVSRVALIFQCLIDTNSNSPALPEQCPSCEASRHQTNQKGRILLKGLVKSPIRGLSTGLGATVNLVAGNACYHLGEEDKLADTIIFNDSRATHLIRRLFR